MCVCAHQTQIAVVEVARVCRDIWAKADSLVGTGRMAGLVSVSGGRRKFDNPKVRSVRERNIRPAGYIHPAMLEHA